MTGSHKPIRLLSIVLPLWLLAAPMIVVGEEQQAQEAFFSQKVAPLLTSECLSCHGSEQKGRTRFAERYDCAGRWRQW